MDRDQIRTCLEQLNEALRSMSIKGELCLYGGAVMCLVYDARPSTKDVDAVFRPTQQIREAIGRVARANNLREDWLNDAVKGFLTPHPQRVLFDLSNLKVYIPEADYLLAMKALATRADGTDKQDIQFLIQHLGLKTPHEVLAIVEKYYPRHQIKPATQFFIEELFGE